MKQYGTDTYDITVIYSIDMLLYGAIYGRTIELEDLG